MAGNGEQVHLAPIIEGVENQEPQADLVDELFEKAEQEVMSFLPEMVGTELEALCGELGLEIPPEKKGSRRGLYRLVLGHLMDQERENDDGGKAKYIQVHGVLRQMAMAKAEEANKHTEPPPPDHKPMRDFNMNMIDAMMEPQDGTRTTPLGYRPPGAEENARRRLVPKVASLYHLKECKIRGSIGDPGEKDKLGYYGLISEIKERQNEGYDDDRIVGAVINAVTPGNVFKRRLEMRRNLEGSIPLPILHEMLKTHYQEKGSSSIFRELSDAVQGADEKATTFCNRLIVIRDEALSRSIEEGCRLDVQYLKKRFLKSFATGLRNGNIRNELREILKTEPSDDELLKSIGEAVRGEDERAVKMAELKRGSLGADVSLVQREKNDFQVGKKDLWSAKLEQMKANHQQEMNELRADISEIKHIFKSGLSNLSAVAANPSFNAIPPLPSTANAGQPLVVQDTSDFGMGTLNLAQQSQSYGPAVQQQPQQYVIPQMRNQNNLQSNQMSTNMQGLPSLPRRNRPRFQGCTACVNQNNPRCNHCFYCGGLDHKIENCPVRQRAVATAQARAQAGNGPSPVNGTGVSGN